MFPETFLNFFQKAIDKIIKWVYNNIRVKERELIVMKEFLNVIFVIFCTCCCFGGGAVFGIGFCWLLNINGTPCAIITVVSLFLFSVLGFYLTEKFNDKF